MSELLLHRSQIRLWKDWDYNRFAEVQVDVGHIAEVSKDFGQCGCVRPHVLY